MLSIQVQVRLLKSFVALVDVFELCELIRVLTLHVLQELIETLELLLLALDSLIHGFEFLEPLLVLHELFLFRVDVQNDALSRDVVFFFFLLELLKVVRKFNQVVLDKQVLLAQLLLPYAGTVFFFFKVLFLIVEGPLHLVHKSALFK